MSRTFEVVALALTLALSACSKEAQEQTSRTATIPHPTQTLVSGEHLVYTIGCVNCHHQTPKEILNAPPLTLVQTYSLPEFRKLMKTGVTRDGRDMYAQGSVMGIVAREQLSRLTDQEVVAIHEFLQSGWTAERGAAEEQKIATFPPPRFKKN